MSMISSKSQVPQKQDKSEVPVAGETMKRRGWLLGLGAAGVAVVAAKVLPDAAVVEDSAIALAPLAAPEGGGYQLSPHVLRYYETARS